MEVDGELPEFVPLENGEEEDRGRRQAATNAFAGWTDSSDSEDAKDDPEESIADEERRKFNEGTGLYNLRVDRWDIPKQCPYCIDKQPWKNLEAIFSHAHGVSQPGTKGTSKNKAKHKGLAMFIALDVIKQLKYDANACKRSLNLGLMGRKDIPQVLEEEGVRPEDKMIVWPPRLLIAGLELRFDPERRIKVSVMGNPDLEADIRSMLGHAHHLKKTPKVLFGPTGSSTGFAIAVFEEDAAGEMSSRNLAEKLVNLNRGKKDYFSGKSKATWFGWVPSEADMKEYAPREAYKMMAYAELISQHKNLEKTALEEREKAKKLKLEGSKSKKEIEFLQRQQEESLQEILRMQEAHQQQMEKVRTEEEQTRKRSLKTLADFYEDRDKDEVAKVQYEIKTAFLNKEKELMKRFQQERQKILQQAEREQKTLIDNFLAVANNPDEADKVLNAQLQEQKDKLALDEQKRKRHTEVMMKFKNILEERKGIQDYDMIEEQLREMELNVTFSYKPLYMDAVKEARAIVREDPSVLPFKNVADKCDLTEKLMVLIKKNKWLPDADDVNLFIAAEGLAMCLVGEEVAPLEEEKTVDASSSKSAAVNGEDGKNEKKLDAIARVRAQVMCPQNWRPLKVEERTDCMGMKFCMYAIDTEDEFYKKIANQYTNAIADAAAEVILERELYNASGGYGMRIPYDKKYLYRELYNEMSPAHVIKALYEKYKEVVAEKAELSSLYLMQTSTERVTRSKRKRICN